MTSFRCWLCGTSALHYNRRGFYVIHHYPQCVVLADQRAATGVEQDAQIALELAGEFLGSYNRFLHMPKLVP